MIWWFAVFSFFAVQAHAQNIAPSQVTPQTLRPKATTVSPSIDIPSIPGLAPPSGSEKLSVTLSKVTVVGAFGDMVDATRALTSEVSGKRVSVAEIFAAASRYEQAYINSGYSLVRVVIPAQSIVDGGSLEITVIDGFIEEVDVSRVAESVRAAVLARLVSIEARKGIKQADIERAMLLAGEVPGARLKSALARGAQPGGTRLVVEGTHDRVAGGTGSDNRLSTSLGGWSASSNIALNSLLGVGEQLYASLNATPEFWRLVESDAPLRSFGAGLVVPIGTDGWTLNLEYTQTRSRPEPSLGAPATIGSFDRVALRTSYPLLKLRAETISVNSELAYLAEATHALGFPSDLKRDEFMVGRSGVDAVRSFDDGTVVSIGANVSQGLGGRSAADAAASGVPLSRSGSQPDFSKVTASASFSRPLADRLFILLSARAQSSFGEALPQSEMLALDQADALSSYLPGTFSFDQGASARAELQGRLGPLPEIKGSEFTPYLFASGGVGALNAPTALEDKRIHASSVGGGVRINLGDPDGIRGFGGRFGLEAARGFSDSRMVADESRANITVGLQF